MNYNYIYGSILPTDFKEEYELRNGILYRKVFNKFRKVLNQNSKESIKIIKKLKYENIKRKTTQL